MSEEKNTPKGVENEIEQQNKEVFGYLVAILVSMLTSIFTNYLLSR